MSWVIASAAFSVELEITKLVETGIATLFAVVLFPVELLFSFTLEASESFVASLF